jgi:hypothetical protein
MKSFSQALCVTILAAASLVVTAPTGKAYRSYCQLMDFIYLD